MSLLSWAGKFPYSLRLTHILGLIPPPPFSFTCRQCLYLRAENFIHQPKIPHNISSHKESTLQQRKCGSECMMIKSIRHIQIMHYQVASYYSKGIIMAFWKHSWEAREEMTSWENKFYLLRSTIWSLYSAMSPRNAIMHLGNNRYKLEWPHGTISSELLEKLAVLISGLRAGSASTGWGTIGVPMNLMLKPLSSQFELLVLIEKKRVNVLVQVIDHDSHEEINWHDKRRKEKSLCP